MKMITDIRYNEDGKLYAKLLGHIDIYGTDLNDLRTAAREAFTCFCIIAETHGQGLQQELEGLI